MFYDVTNTNFCEDCSREKHSTYSNLKRAKLRLSHKDYNDIKDEITIKSMEESWISLVNPPAHVQTEESCLFMLNFNKAGDTMVTSSVNIIDIWDFASKKKLKSLTDHTEIVTSIEWLKSPQDDLFISCSLDKTMKVWKNYNCIETLTHHQDWLRCMSISKDNQYLISGCVSSMIWGYDLQKRQPVWNIANREGDSNLNTINSLDFQQDSLVFLCGTRDGYIRLFDIRANSQKPVHRIFSHESKLNSALFGPDNNSILSAGRDSTIRLWDLRKTQENNSWNSLNGKGSVKGFTAEYTGHISKGYNIAAHFFVGGKYIITGSEDGYVYIYNTQTTKIARKIAAGTKTIHLLKPYPRDETGFAYSGLQRSTIHFYDAKTPEDLKQKKETKNKYEQMGTDSNDNSIKFIEDFMSENGDLILKVFHSNNITYSSGMTWDNLLKVITRQHDADSQKLFTKLNEVLLRNMHHFLQNPQSFNNSQPREKSEAKEKPRVPVSRDLKPKTNCSKCNELQKIKQQLIESLDLDCDLIKNLP